MFLKEVNIIKNEKEIRSLSNAKRYLELYAFNEKPLFIKNWQTNNAKIPKKDNHIYNVVWTCQFANGLIQEVAIQEKMNDTETEVIERKVLYKDKFNSKEVTSFRNIPFRPFSEIQEIYKSTHGYSLGLNWK